MVTSLYTDRLVSAAELERAVTVLHASHLRHQAEHGCSIQQTESQIAALQLSNQPAAPPAFRVSHGRVGGRVSRWGGESQGQSAGEGPPSGSVVWRWEGGPWLCSGIEG